MAEVRTIDANALREEFNRPFWEKWEWDIICKTIDNAPTVTPEITDEDIRDAIKQGYKDGYAMARAKFERPKGDIEFAKWVADQIFFKEVKDDLFVELACRKLEKLGLVEKTESEWILRGGGENE